MRIQELMSHPAVTCHPTDSLSKAAQLMWEADIGTVLVVGTDQKLAGIITDRDIAMATYLQGKAPADIHVDSVMAKQVYACQPSDSLEIAAILMGQKQVRRIPVVDDDGHPLGVLSLADLTRDQANGRSREDAAREILALIAMICEPRTETPPAELAAHASVHA
jgi:CBS domain-containing protein